MKKNVSFNSMQQVIAVSETSNSTTGDAIVNAAQDLPGRVSFNKNNTNKFDYDDDDQDNDFQSINKSLNMEKNFLCATNKFSVSEPIINIDEKKVCCKYKCNAIEGDYKDSESEKIFDDYKKEIGTTNLEHQMKTHVIDVKLSSHVPNIADTEPLCNVQNIITSPDHAYIRKMNTPDSTISNKTPKLGSKEKIVTNSSSKSLDERNKYSRNISISSDISTKSNYKGTTKPINEVINQKKKSKITRSNTARNATLLNSTRYSENKQDTYAVDKVSNSDRDLSTHMDFNASHVYKVESWMNTVTQNEFKHTRNAELSINPSKLMSIENNCNSNEYESGWTDTPNSKTDDEGNFSLDDHADAESSYEEIASIIREIENQKKAEDTHMCKMNLESNGAVKSSGSLSDSGKVRDIITYLDEVDSNCEEILKDAYSLKLPDSNRTEAEFVIEPDVLGDFPKMTELIPLTNHQLAQKVISLTLRSNELSNAIHMSKEHITSLQNEKNKLFRLETQNFQIQFKEQKSYYEHIVTRHQTFIEQLLKDKSTLCEKISTLTRRLDSQNQAWKHKLEAEICRIKEAQAAGEKIRRERWEKENTKKIKELTVKGLEQEINKMASDYQRETNELKKQHQKELLDAADEMRQKHEIIEKNIRDTYAADRELSIEVERSAIRMRFERQINLEQKSFEEEKSKLLSDFGEEKNRLYDEIKSKEDEFGKRKADLLREKERCIDELKTDYTNQLKIQEDKHQTEINALRGQCEADFTIWKKEYENSIRIREVEHENEIRNECRLDRDKQIDEILAKVDAESVKRQEEFDNRTRRLKEKYEADIKEIEQMEKKYRDLYAETRSKLAEMEASTQNLEAIVKQLQIQLSHSQKMCDDFVRNQEEFKVNTRKEMQIEIKNLKQHQDDEMQNIHSRVQQTIEKKNTSLELLQKENNDLKDRCIKLEAIIRQQRKDYCTK